MVTLVPSLVSIFSVGSSFGVCRCQGCHKATCYHSNGACCKRLSSHGEGHPWQDKGLCWGPICGDIRQGQQWWGAVSCSRYSEPCGTQSPWPGSLCHSKDGTSSPGPSSFLPVSIWHFWFFRNFILATVKRLHEYTLSEVLFGILLSGQF